MNKSLLLVLAIALLGIVGVGGFFAITKNKTSGTIETKTTASDVSTQKKTLTDFLTGSGSQECTFKDAMGNGGTVYTANGKFRGDFSAKVNEVITATHMYSDGTTVYVWIDGQSQGFKTSLNAVSELSNNQNAKTIDVNQQADYSCKGANPSASLFSYPATITFTDLSELMKSIPATIEAGESMEAGASAQNMKATQCAACDQLSGSAQTQCKQVLGC